MRIQKYNVNRVNALQNTLDYETQDDLIASLLDRLENSMSQEQRLMFDMYMKTYEVRNKKKITLIYLQLPQYFAILEIRKRSYART
ncbi:DUF5388 domain-containing protein [Enterococcus mundtii]|uniref:DUF5388 domain-containing protein n=1 Tax=Enterococcus mundtii TaxID=53346 RepID=UPI0021581E0F|nr:hypothetical protein [Enterococcus mundtii]